MTKPVKFQSIAIANAVCILLKHKTTEQNALEHRTKELLIDFKNIHEEQYHSADKELVLVSGKDHIIQKLKLALLNAETGICIVTSCNRFSWAILEFALGYQKALKKGVKIRIATEQHAPGKTALKILKVLLEDPNFEVKYFASSPPAIVTIVDSKEIFVTMSAVADFPEGTAIWSRNNSLVALAISYFETLWKDSIMSVG